MHPSIKKPLQDTVRACQEAIQEESARARPDPDRLAKLKQEESSARERLMALEILYGPYWRMRYFPTTITGWTGYQDSQSSRGRSWRPVVE